MNQSTDATSDELLDWALRILGCQDRETKKAARWGLKQIVESVRADWESPRKPSRETTAEQLNELARAATTASRRLTDPDVRRVLELHMPATRKIRLQPDTLPRLLRELAKAAAEAAADPDLHGGGKATIEDVFDLPARTKLAALVDPFFKHFRGKRGVADENSDLDVLLNYLWEIISGEAANQSFERHIQQARAKTGRKTDRRVAALLTARLEAQEILDVIRKKQQQ